LSKGYKYISNKPLHVLIAEKALKKELPVGAVVHHANGDFTDNSNENLVICPSQSYHLLIHQRLDAYKASGNPAYRKCTVCKKYDDPLNMYVTSAVAWHRSCRNEKKAYLKQQRKM
jgi:hypothetical protein